MNKFLTILVLVLLITYESRACDCPFPSSDLEENWGYAEQIFIGQVLKSSSDELYSAGGVNFAYYTVQILESIKGNFHPKYRLRTFVVKSRGSCDYVFEEGKKYLIYADETDHIILQADICSRTAPLDEVEETEIEVLRQISIRHYGEGRRPYVVVEKSETEQDLELARSQIKNLSNKNKWLLRVSIALALLLLLSVLLTLRRKKDKVQHGS